MCSVNVQFLHCQLADCHVLCSCKSRLKYALEERLIRCGFSNMEKGKTSGCLIQECGGKESNIGTENVQSEHGNGTRGSLSLGKIFQIFKRNVCFIRSGSSGGSRGSAYPQARFGE